MTQREAFEKWYVDQFARLGQRNDPANSLYTYADSHTHVAWLAWQAATRHAAQQCTCPAKDMPFGRCCKVLTSEGVIARQQHVMQRAMDAWDSTTHQKNGDGRLWQCMEELRGECAT